MRIFGRIIGRMTFASRQVQLGVAGPEHSSLPRIRVILGAEAQAEVPSHKLSEFRVKGVTESLRFVEKEGTQSESWTRFYSEKGWVKAKEIDSDAVVSFSQAVQSQIHFPGLASEVISRGYKFSRKERPEKAVQVYTEGLKQREYIESLVRAKLRAQEWANTRGNQGSVDFMLERAGQVARKTGAILRVIRGEQLLDQGFRLVHAVGRASVSPPAVVSLELRGDPESEEWVSLVGKGICFDSGGLDLKTAAGMAGMHVDKHGACSVLSAFEGVKELGLKVNVVAVLGLAQNSVSSVSYRPLDIITSRKGLTVQIGNTDAEGRLVLADCMHWVQQNYKIKRLIELSTLTGAIITALGRNRAGLFSNSASLVASLNSAAHRSQQLVWMLPLDAYHHELIKGKSADITNSSSKSQASSSQAAAFLSRFVEKGTEWAHIDIAGTAMNESLATGWGARLLLQTLRQN